MERIMSRRMRKLVLVMLNLAHALFQWCEYSHNGLGGIVYITMFVYANEKDIRRFAKELTCENRLASAR